MIWDPYYECMELEQRRELQLRRLREMVARLAVNVPWYQARFAQIDFHPEDLKSLEDLASLPFVSKVELRDNYPLELLACPASEVVRIHSSSGTTGRPIIAGYTAEDINTWAETIARTICCGGGTRHDILQVAYGYGLFTGGLGLHYGGERLGCMVIPMSAGNTARQLMMMRDLGTTILACTPSYALTLADALEEEGVSVEELKLRSGLFGAEPWSEGSRQAVESMLRLSAHDIYGLTEIIGPGVAGECEAKNGLHVFDDHFYPEIIDPDTGQVLPEGQRGELVFTSLTKRAFPLLRFRTRDISALHYEPCSCGRTHARMDRITGRTDDMLIIRGVNVFPSQIEEVLTAVEGVMPHYQLVVTREGRMDQLEVRVEVSADIFSDTVRGLEQVQAQIEEELHKVLGLHAKVSLVEPKSIERSIGKAKRIIDQREAG
ncbi:MAG: phenylacetate--CoA ligase [candidate division WS1 bacterium]|nr:phenylacetate--CoA ligase [candidate division WS1 bacterium]